MESSLNRTAFGLLFVLFDHRSPLQIRSVHNANALLNTTAPLPKNAIRPTNLLSTNDRTHSTVWPILPSRLEASRSDRRGRTTSSIHRGASVHPVQLQISPPNSKYRSTTLPMPWMIYSSAFSSFSACGRHSFPPPASGPNRRVSLSRLVSTTLRSDVPIILRCNLPTWQSEEASSAFYGEP